MNEFSPAPPAPWEDKPEPEKEVDVEARRQLIEQAREQSYLESKKIYGTRFEAMGRMATTLLGKGWLWNRGEGGKDQSTEKSLQWVGKHIDIPLAKLFEENKVLRGLKIAGKITVGAAGVAALAGVTVPAALLIGAPMGVDAILDTIQFFKERGLVKQWQGREALRKELTHTDTNEDRKNNILGELSASQGVVDRLAGSKRRWGWGRFLGKMAATGGAAAFMHFHGISEGIKDYDKIHDAAKNILAHHHGGTGLSGQEQHIVNLSRLMDEKHQVVQHLDHAEFVYNKGHELENMLKMENAGALSVIHRGSEASHWLSNQSMVGVMAGVFGAVSADAFLTNESAHRAPSPTSLPTGATGGEVFTEVPTAPTAAPPFPEVSESSEPSEIAGPDEAGVFAPPPEPWLLPENAGEVVAPTIDEEKPPLIEDENKVRLWAETAEINGNTKYFLLDQYCPRESTLDWQVAGEYQYTTSSGDQMKIYPVGLVEHDGRKYWDCDLMCDTLDSDRLTHFLIPFQEESTEPKKVEDEENSEEITKEEKQIREIAIRYLTYDIDTTGWDPDDAKNQDDQYQRKVREINQGHLTESQRKYASMIAEFQKNGDLDRFEKLADKVHQEFMKEMKRFNIRTGPHAATKTWAFWDIAKQYYLWKNPTQSSPEYRLVNPFEDEEKQHEMSDRMIGWEFYGNGYYFRSPDWLDSDDEYDTIKNLHRSPKWDEIRSLLTKPPKEGPIENLSSADLARLGRLVREESKS